MQPESRNLDEVVVVGYGTTRLKDLTGAVSSVNAGQLEKEPVMNVASALQERLPVYRCQWLLPSPGNRRKSG